MCGSPFLLVRKSGSETPAGVSEPQIIKLSAAAQNLCGAPLFYLPAVILPKYMLSVCAMCTNKRANGCFLVDKSQK
jgi:hypothetical protein